MDLVTNSSRVIVTNQSAGILKCGILSLSLLVSVGFHASQGLDNVEILRRPFVQVVIDIVGSFVNLFESRGLAEASSVELFWGMKIE